MKFIILIILITFKNSPGSVGVELLAVPPSCDTSKPVSAPSGMDRKSRPYVYQCSSTDGKRAIFYNSELMNQKCFRCDFVNGSYTWVFEFYGVNCSPIPCYGRIPSQ